MASSNPTSLLTRLITQSTVFLSLSIILMVAAVSATKVPFEEQRLMFGGLTTAYREILFFGFAALAAMAIVVYGLPSKIGRPFHSNDAVSAAFWLMDAGIVSFLSAWFLGLPGVSVEELTSSPFGNLYSIGVLLGLTSIFIFSLEVLLTTSRPWKGASGEYSPPSFRAALNPSSQVSGSHIRAASVSSAVIGLAGILSLLIFTVIQTAFRLDAAFIWAFMTTVNTLWLSGQPLLLLVTLPAIGLILDHVEEKAQRPLGSIAGRAWTIFFALGLVGYVSITTQFFNAQSASSIRLTVTLLAIIPLAMVTVASIRALNRSFAGQLVFRFMIIGLIGGLAGAIITSWMHLTGGFIGDQVAHIALISVMPVIFGATYLILPKAYGSIYSHTLSEVHFANSTLAGPGLTIMLLGLGYSGLLSSQLFNPQVAPTLTWGILLLWLIAAAGQLLLIVNTFRTTYR